MKTIVLKALPVGVLLAAAAGVGIHGLSISSRLPATRSFEMGLSYWPQDGEKTTDELVGKSIGRTIALSEHILIQLPWSPTRPDLSSGASWMARVAREHSRGLTIAMDWMEPTRDQLRDGGEKSWNFRDVGVRDAFAHAAVECAQRYRPEYLILGVEVNYFAYNDPEGFRQFVIAYEEAYRKVKSASPTTKVLVTFQYEVLMGLDREWKATAGMEPVHAFGPLLDVIGLSSYPFLAGPLNEQSVSGEYFEPVRKMGQMWGIFETSHPTNPGSRREMMVQSDYAEALLTACTRKGAAIVVWCGTTDTNLAPHSGPKATAVQDGAWMASLGLCDIKGEPKLAVAPWRSTMSLMRNPSLVANGRRLEERQQPVASH